MDEFIKKLKERYERGEISKEAYEDILSRYTSERMGARDGSDGREEKIDKNRNVPENEMDEEGEDYKCAGRCIIGSGAYRYISATGSIKITGNITANKISVAGSIKADGDIKTDNFKGAGSMEIDGDIQGEDISVGGSLKARNIRGDTIRLGGAIAAERISGDKISMGGSVKAQKIQGDIVKIELEGESVVNLIHGDRIEITAKRGILRKCSGKMVVDEIHGDEVRIECTRAKIVDSDTAVIGVGCEIEVLKAEKIKINRNAKVGKVVRK